LLKQQEAVIADTENKTKKNVVVVEDNPIERQLYEIKFAEWGLPINLIIASNGFEGLIEIGRSNPDFIITDLDMPGMDGFEMIKSILEMNTQLTKQIVIVTGLNESEIVERRGLPKSIPIFHKPIPFDAIKTLLFEKKIIKQIGKKNEMEVKIDQPIDISTIISFVGDAKDTHCKIFKIFSDTTPEIIAEILAAQKARSANIISQQAHKLKSSARCMGSDELGDICQSLETAGNEKNWDDIDVLIPRIEPLFEGIERFIEEYCEL